MSEPSLQIAINKALAESTIVHGDELSVEVLGGHAFLRGRVATIADRELAERTASAVPGVRLVQNELEVHPSGLVGGAYADAKASVADVAAVDHY